ncbi:MAG: hypothetical protein ACLGI9_07220 [Thermoanaerobaculia bacterium]
MNNNDAIAVVISSGLSLLGLAWLYLWPYRDYRRDLFRARLFAIRGELFDGAADGKIDFSHPAYGLLRSTLNGFLRFGPHVGALRLIAMVLVTDQREFARDYDFDRRWSEANKTLNADQRKWLEGLREQMHRALLKHLFATSFLGCFLLFAVLGGRMTKAHRSHRRKAAPGHRELTSRIDSVALANNYQPYQNAA